MMDMDERSERRKYGVFHRQVGGILLMIGGGLVLLALFWLPFDSEFTIRAHDSVVLGRVQSLTQWQYIPQLEVLLIPFTFIVLVTAFALLLGIAQAFGIGGSLKRLGWRFRGRFFLFLILALLAQGFDAFVATVSFLNDNPCLSVQNTCTGTYTEWRGDSAIGWSVVGLIFLMVGFLLSLPWQERASAVSP